MARKLNFQRLEIIFSWGSVYFNLNCDGSSPGGWCEGECKLDSDRRRGVGVGDACTRQLHYFVTHTPSRAYTVIELQPEKLLSIAFRSLMYNMIHIPDS